MEEDSKCKEKGKRSGVWKKSGKEIYFFLKEGNFLLQYFFEKKLLQDLPHPHDNACDASWSGGICRHKNFSGLNYH